MPYSFRCQLLNRLFEQNRSFHCSVLQIFVSVMTVEKNPYTIELAGQVAEIPFQMFHHLRASRPLSRPEKHRFGKAWRQYLLIWMPPAGLPAYNNAVVMYHGGGWRVGWPGLFPTTAEFFLREGRPVIMPAYRLTPWACYKQMREDLNLALVKSLQLLREKGIKEPKILAGGISAGATLAAHLVFDRKELQKLNVDQDLFTGFMSIAGPLDLDLMPDFRAVRNYAGGKPGSSDFYAANPANLLSGEEKTPVLLVHSTSDALVPYQCAKHFYDKYSGPRQMCLVPHATHLGTMRFTTDDPDTARVIHNWMTDK